jgi:hypothetical protein
VEEGKTINDGNNSRGKQEQKKKRKEEHTVKR